MLASVCWNAVEAIYAQNHRNRRNLNCFYSIFAKKRNSHSHFEYIKNHKIKPRNYCFGVITLCSPLKILLLSVHLPLWYQLTLYLAEGKGANYTPPKPWIFKSFYGPATWNEAKFAPFGISWGISEYTVPAFKAVLCDVYTVQWQTIKMLNRYLFE